MSHVRRLPNSRFEARYRGPDGREHAKRFGSKRDAVTFLARLDVDRQGGDWRDPGGARILVADWVQRWFDTIVDLRPSSLSLATSRTSAIMCCPDSAHCDLAPSRRSRCAGGSRI